VLKENLRLLVPLLLVAVFLGGTLLVHYYQNHSKAISVCGLRDDKTLQIGNKKITVQVETTPQDKAKGLGGKTCIGPNEGMLFVFDQPSQYQFWMKDMKFPIDMIWIAVNHKVTVVEENVLPSSYYSKQPFFVNPQDKPAQYVLELQAHASTKLNINSRTTINF
jgi:uncharacterized membrane protein (UPF0127 family)